MFCRLKAIDSYTDWARSNPSRGNNWSAATVKRMTKGAMVIPHHHCFLLSIFLVCSCVCLCVFCCVVVVVARFVVCFHGPRGRRYVCLFVFLLIILLLLTLHWWNYIERLFELGGDPNLAYRYIIGAGGLESLKEYPVRYNHSRPYHTLALALAHTCIHALAGILAMSAQHSLLSSSHSLCPRNVPYQII